MEWSVENLPDTQTDAYYFHFFSLFCRARIECFRKIPRGRDPFRVFFAEKFAFAGDP